MPRVGFAMPMLGFRPKTNPGRALAGLRGLGDGRIPSDAIKMYEALFFSPSTGKYYDSVGNDISGDAGAISQAAAGVTRPTRTGASYDPGYVPGAVNADPSIAAEQANPDYSCSLWDYWTDSCSSVNRAQIQSVAANAAKYYGPDSVTAQVAQKVATDQASQVGSDVSSVQQFYSTGAGSTAGNFLGLPWWAWLAGGVVLWKELK